MYVTQLSVRPYFQPSHHWYSTVWMLGNLARATYVGSADFIWPFSYNLCDEQHRQGQEISACSAVNHYGLAPFRGRGSPEIDVVESMQGDDEDLPNTWIKRPYQSASLQIAPGVEIDRPVLGHRPHKVCFTRFVEAAPIFNPTALSQLRPAEQLVQALGVRQ